MKTSKRRRLAFRSLELLIEGLDGVRSLLPSAYGGSVDEDDEDSYFEPGQIESAEVEVALSSIVSTMTTECDLPEEPESLSDLLSKIYSPEDEAVNIALNLEEAVNGYFGELFGEDLDLADDYLVNLIDILKDRRDKWKARKESQGKLDFE